MAPLWIRAEMARVNIRSATDLAMLLQTGGEALTELVRGVTANTDDNGLVEFAAPKALYLETQNENMSLIQGDRGDPMTALAPLVRTPDSPDSLRLELIRRWIRREKIPKATRAASFFMDPVMKAQADDLLQAAK